MQRVHLKYLEIINKLPWWNIKGFIRLKKWYERITKEQASK